MAGQEVVCTAQNDAALDGLLTVLHQDRVEEGISSTLDMPLLSEHDTHALQKISGEFEVCHSCYPGTIFLPSGCSLMLISARSPATCPGRSVKPFDP